MNNKSQTRYIAAAVSILLGMGAAATGQDDSGEDVFELSPFEVTADETRYTATNTISATRTNIKIADFAANIQVITDTLIEDLNVQDPSRALNILGSVSTNDDPGGSMSGAGVDRDRRGQNFGRVVIRGLTTTANLQNGIRSEIQPTPATVERVELIKGPASVLYGLTQPGGIFNVITKKPVYGRSFGSVTGQVSRFDQWMANIDYNYQVADNVALRLILNKRKQNTEWKFTEADNVVINPMLSLKLTDTTEIGLSYLSEERTSGWADYRFRFGRDYVPDSWDGPTAKGMQIPWIEVPEYRNDPNFDPTFNWAGPDSSEHINLDQFDVTLRQKFGEDFNLQLQWRHAEREYDIFRNQVALITPGSTTFWHDQNIPFMLGKWEFFDRDQTTRNLVATGIYKKDTEWGDHTVTFGYQSFDRRQSKLDGVEQTDYRTRDDDGNILTPLGTTELADEIIARVIKAQGANHALNYPSLNNGLLDQRPNRPPPGVWFRYFPMIATEADVSRPDDLVVNALPPGVGSFQGSGNGAFGHNTDETLYLSYHGKFLEDRLILQGGLYQTSILNKDGRGFDELFVNFDERETLPQYGAIYRVAKGIGLFVSYSESLDSNSGRRNWKQETFPPLSGEGSEFGIKFDTLKGKLSGTLSYFDITLKNRVVFDDNAPNPTDPNDQMGDWVARGINTSEGIDLDLFYAPTEQLQFIFSFTTTDVVSDGDPNPLQNGVNEVGSYDYAWGLVTSYQIKEGRFNGLGMGFSVNYTDDVVMESIQTRYTGASNPYQRSAKGEYEGNVFLSYKTVIGENPWTFRLNLNNVFEKAFYNGWDPSVTNEDGIAFEPFYYPTEMTWALSATMDF